MTPLFGRLRKLLFRPTLTLLVLVLGLAAATQAQQYLNPAKLAEMDAAILNCIETNGTPGGVLWVERLGSVYHKAYGKRALRPEPEAMSEDTIFDAASLTKVLATTPAIMLLVERGKLEVDAPASRYFPEFQGAGKERITLRQLLTHTSGLRPDLSLTSAWSGHDKAIELACAEKLLSAPGTVFRYSDINFIVLGEIVERVSGQSLAQFTEQELYRPLKMVDTSFLPAPDKRNRIAPTEEVGGQWLRGVVHDPTARRMGGVAGHAGVFTTAADLARYARMLLNEGELEGTRIFKPETIQLMTRVQSPTQVTARRGLGWDIDSGYSRPRGNLFPLGSYGHTGFTGTCLWIDPFSKTFWLFLSNRVHPDGKGNVLPLQARLGTLAAEAVVGFNFADVPGVLPPREASEPVRPALPHYSFNARVLNGIDVLVKQNFAPLQRLRLGLITNHTGTDAQRRATIDLLVHASNVVLKALFSPEHGIRGAADEKVGDTIDEQTGLPIYSLYGERRSPSEEQLRDLDALVFDIQDIGCRFYTYISTLGNCLEAAAHAHLKFFVLDRVNPINGLVVDGPVLAGPRSFTAYHELPVRHGMTAGELARMFNAERHLDADLTVIPLQGWQRGMWFDETELPWTNPSPNMRSLTEAALYPGIGLLETANVSVGRGTDTPFEVVGAPYIDDLELAAELNRLQLPGVRFVPIRFSPTASVFKGKSCGGVSILLLDREHCRVLDLGLGMAQTLHRLYPADFGLEKLDRLLGHPKTINALRQGQSLAAIRELWRTDLVHFAERREQYLLYK